MTFDEALAILEMSPDGDPAEARRVYLLQLQRNGPEVPPDLYDRLTAAYEVLKHASVWPQSSSGSDHAHARDTRGRRRSTRSSDGPRIIDPGRVPQRKGSQSTTRIIDPTRVPQRNSGSSESAPTPAEPPRRARPRRVDPRQEAPTEVFGDERGVERPQRTSAPRPEPIDTSDPFAEVPTTHAPPEPETFEPETFEPATFEPATFEPATFEPETFEPKTEQPAASHDPFADLLGTDAIPSSAGPAIDLTLGGNATVSNEAPEPAGAEPTAPSPAPAEPQAAPEPMRDPMLTPSPAPTRRPTRPSSRRAPSKKKKALDDASIAILSKIARTYSGLINFPELVSTLESSPDDAIGLVAADLLSKGERVAACGLLVAGFDAMEGHPSRRWIDVRGCLEVILKFSETASEDHTDYECALSVRRALARWRTETEDPRLVFQEATLTRWRWLNELTDLPQALPHALRGELVHGIRAGDLEECVLAVDTWSKKNPEELKKWLPSFEQKSPQLWGELTNLIKTSTLKGAKAPSPEEKPAGKEGRAGGRAARSGRRRQGGGQSSRFKVPGWAWAALFVTLCVGTFGAVVGSALEDQVSKDDIEVAGDAICKVVGGNKPACIEGRRVARYLRDGDCDVLSGSVIQDFSDAIAAARALQGAVATGASDIGNLQAHRETLVNEYFRVCQPQPADGDSAGQPAGP